MAVEQQNAVQSKDKRFNVNLAAPLSEFDTPRAKAFPATLSSGAGRRLVALVVPPRTGFRHEVLASLSKVPVRGMVRLVSDAILETPEGERLAVIMERPDSRRIWPRGARRGPQLSVDTLRQTALGPLLSTLRDLWGRRIAHRAIRPDNLFIDGTGQITLGECVTAYPGADQPSLFEPIEQAAAHPMGRGEGDSAADLYALGVSLAVMIGGRYPNLDGGSPDAELAARLKLGSFRVATHGVDIPKDIHPMLQGLLLDAADRRWNASDLEQWISGSNAGRQAKLIHRQVERSFTFENEDFDDPRLLAVAFRVQWNAALRAVDDPKFARWVRHNLPDKKMSDTLSRLLEASDARPEQRLSRIIAALNPDQPIVFEQLCITVDGVGRAAGAFWDNSSKRQQLVRLLTSGVHQSWAEMQTNPGPKVRQTVEVLNTMAKVVARPQPGYGYERLMYELNRSLPCLSPAFANFAVQDEGDLLLALEEIAGRRGRPSVPLDRHCAAFLAVRVKSDAPNWLWGLSKPQGSPSNVMAPLQVLAQVQEKHEIGALPQLAEWLVSYAKPAVRSFRNRQTREEIEGRIARLAGAGILAPIADAIDNPKARQTDEKGFRRAVQMIAGQRQVARRIEKEIECRHDLAKEAGGVMAVTVSAVFAILSVALFSGFMLVD